MASKLYTNVYKAAFNKEIDWDSDTIKVALLTSGYAPNQDGHAYLSDVRASEVTGTGYTAGGKALTSKTVTVDPSTNTTKFDADDLVWANSSITARYAVVYDDAGATDSQKALICYHDFGVDKASSQGELNVRFNADGVFSSTAN